MTDSPSDAALGRWLVGQRWFAAPAVEPAVTDRPHDPADDPAAGADGGSGVAATTVLPLVDAGGVAVSVVDTSAGDRYQLLVHASSSMATSTTTTPARGAGHPAADLGSDPHALDALARWVTADGTGPTVDGASVTGRWLPDATPLGAQPTRLLGAEQSNTSAIVGGTHVLKLLRRLQAGPHPELEVGRHFASLDRDLPTAALAGWYELRPASGEATTLGVVQDLVPGAIDGWGLTLSALAGDPGAFLADLRRLGEAVAVLHGALAEPAAGSHPDPDAPEAFGSVGLDPERLASVTAGTAADAERVLATTIDRPVSLATVAGRAGDVAALAERLATRLGTDLGAAIRHHGDLHLGQTVVGHDGWVILDFEGEPARPLSERRQRHSPLRDVAGLLRSLAYAVATHERATGRALPGWERAARAALLDGYLSTADPALLPRSAAATSQLLSVFELEKVVYEIGYELAHRPDWVELPARGLRTLLDGGAP
jgi:maltokinase